MTQFLTQSFIGNKAIIQVIRAQDGFFSFSGSKIMALKPKLWWKIKSGKR